MRICGPIATSMRWRGLVRAKGGAIEEGTRIESIEREGARIARVRTSRGDFSGREVVLALGAWSPMLARQLGLRSADPARQGLFDHLHAPAARPRMPLVLKERSVCVTAWSSGYRLGSTMEFAGYDTSLNRTRLDALRRGAAEYLHEPEGPDVVEEWYGWRPMTPDDLPMLGRAPGVDNLVLATGHGMLGVSMSAISGLLDQRSREPARRRRSISRRTHATRFQLRFIDRGRIHASTRTRSVALRSRLRCASAADGAAKPPGDPVQFQWGVKIPMRDGVKLNATLYRPLDQKEPLPCVFTLTPYIAQSYHDRGMYFAGARLRVR